MTSHGADTGTTAGKLSGMSSMSQVKSLGSPPASLSLLPFLPEGQGKEAKYDSLDDSQPLSEILRAVPALKCWFSLDEFRQAAFVGFQGSTTNCQVETRFCGYKREGRLSKKPHNVPLDGYITKSDHEIQVLKLPEAKDGGVYEVTVRKEHEALTMKITFGAGVEVQLESALRTPLNSSSTPALPSPSALPSSSSPAASSSTSNSLSASSSSSSSASSSSSSSASSSSSSSASSDSSPSSDSSTLGSSSGSSPSPALSPSGMKEEKKEEKFDQLGESLNYFDDTDLGAATTGAATTGEKIPWVELTHELAQFLPEDEEALKSYCVIPR